MAKWVGYATGRRKTSVARVFMAQGKGEILVNKKKYDIRFPRMDHQQIILGPLKVTNSERRFDFYINVKGGGITGQADAIRLGIARALVSYNEKFKEILKKYDLLTRDPRMVERKKPGQRGARARFQFSKR
ncbi:30S ribosomal protein S9 [bacterium]|nr:30S ribosomal protein S9 [bacterium]MCK5398520.1 30S ribosomal protein S9 [bacterium]MCK5598103.1 30S ribosomal protein S9 [bacterium]